MNKHLLQILLALLLLAGCSPALTLPPKATDTPALAQTPTDLPAPTVERITPTGALPPEAIFKYQHLEILPDLPANAVPGGSLVLQTQEKSYWVNFAGHSRHDIPGDNSCMSTSPNGKWLAYCHATSPDASRYEWLIIEGINKQQIKIPMGKDARGAPFGFWLDNEQLVFNLSPAPDGELFPVLIVNPFTGKQTTLRSDYPDIHLDTSISPGGIKFIKSSVVYDPSLETVIYPQSDQTGYSHVVYWDRVHGKALAQIESAGFIGAPLWSPDLSQFVAPIAISKDLRHHNEEWSSVSRSRQVEQLTHWGDLFTDTIIAYNGNWSPNGRYVAFWLDVQPSECEGPNLAVLDVQTRQTIDYCVPGLIGDYIPPIWSPDGRYIAVNSALGDASNQTVLVDLQEGWAAHIADATFPMGWLATEP